MFYDQIKEAYENLGYKFFTGDHNLNLFGIRSPNRNQTFDSFDDLIGVAYTDEDNEKIVKIWTATTDPGYLELTDPSFKAAQLNGTAVLKKGQHLGCYRLGLHGSGNWQHLALRQIKPMPLYRDNNRDAILDLNDETKLVVELAGINLHAASKIKDLLKIGRYSAGCQVIQNFEEHQNLMKLVQIQDSKGYGDIISYTLFNQDEIL